MGMIFLIVLVLCEAIKCPPRMDGCGMKQNKKRCKNETKKLERIVKQLNFKDRLNQHRLTAIESTLVLPEFPGDAKTVKLTQTPQQKAQEKVYKAQFEAMKDEQKVSETNTFVNAMNAYVDSLKPQTKLNKIEKTYTIHDKCAGKICDYLNKKLKAPRCVVEGINLKKCDRLFRSKVNKRLEELRKPLKPTCLLTPKKATKAKKD
ncbi:hypothetical protein EIN_135120 [Entamoeba invadens IP1]|uniref:Uncharacterized protein n=1 Tax=Entamoeba invadens IP1 TaxID=370355 RepID=A0A0A1TXC2_ENTIV|nr:hypothetical protein EIN_135120 [Entamoeba invadens IP1]ELP85928.1 hypothetical protein EIN_135120 [Entamoeba invadens IP1]|eukprot:XP_004185274.1 hypothetical protein EIN_135120 [Entamoeba invadens IP1]